MHQDNALADKSTSAAAPATPLLSQKEGLACRETNLLLANLSLLHRWAAGRIEFYSYPALPKQSFSIFQNRSFKIKLYHLSKFIFKSYIINFKKVSLFHDDEKEF